MSCDVLSDGVAEYATFQFLVGDDLASYYLGRIDGVGLTFDEGACFAGRAEESWARGRVACWVSRTGSKLAHVRWTDDRIGVYGVLDASDRDLLSLYLWWLDNVGNQ